MNRREAKRLVGTAWLDSDYRIAWETRIMRRRVPLYKVTIKALRLLNRLSPGPDRPSLNVTYWERVGPGGTTFMMPKLETMTGRTDAPVTSPSELRARTTFTSRLARVISADEWPQIIEEYESRRRGAAPRFQYISHRPLNRASHELMDKSWATGELPTDEYRAWNGEVKFKDNPGIYSEFYTHGGSRTIPGGENSPAYRRSRLRHDVDWRAKASMDNEIRVLRKARVLRVQQLVKFLGAEASQLIRPGASYRPATARPDEVLTVGVVAAVADFVKPESLRSPTARGETTPDRNRASAVDVANTVQKALPPAINRRAEPATRPSTAGQPPTPSHPSHAAQSPATPPAARPADRPAHSPQDSRSR